MRSSREGRGSPVGIVVVAVLASCQNRVKEVGYLAECAGHVIVSHGGR